MIFKKLLTKIKRKSSVQNAHNEKYISIGNFSLLTTPDDKLPDYLNAYPNYSINFARLSSWIIKESDPSSLIIDIGANIGDTVALLRTFDVKNPVICIEGSDTYFNLLKHNTRLFHDVTIIKSILGDKPHEVIGNISLSNGTGRLFKSDVGDTIEITTLDILLKDKLNSKRVRILKVDTDGYDVSILNGAENILKEHHPVIFFEYDTTLNTSEQSCLNFLFSLSSKGYSKVIFYDNYGRMVIGTDLKNNDVITFLDRYIKNRQGAFEYYDIAVFHESDSEIAGQIIMKESDIN